MTWNIFLLKDFFAEKIATIHGKKSINLIDTIHCIVEMLPHFCANIFLRTAQKMVRDLLQLPVCSVNLREKIPHLVLYSDLRRDLVHYDVLPVPLQGVLQQPRDWHPLPTSWVEAGRRAVRAVALVEIQIGSH